MGNMILGQYPSDLGQRMMRDSGVRATTPALEADEEGERSGRQANGRSLSHSRGGPAGAGLPAHVVRLLAESHRERPLE
jgi:hypothetical protein